MKKETIYIEDNGYRDYPTIKDLMETLEHDKKWHEEHGELEIFLNTPVTLQLSDIEGQIIQGKMCCDVGMCEGNVFVLTGNIDSLEFKVEEK